jgi:hypothetical protein
VNDRVHKKKKMSRFRPSKRGKNVQTIAGQATSDARRADPSPSHKRAAVTNDSDSSSSDTEHSSFKRISLLSRFSKNTRESAPPLPLGVPSAPNPNSTAGSSLEYDLRSHLKSLKISHSIAGTQLSDRATSTSDVSGQNLDAETSQRSQPDEIIPAVDENDTGYDSAIGDDSAIGESSSTIGSSVLNYIYEYGRRYHLYGQRYLRPNDEQEMDSEDLLHHIYLTVLDSKLFLGKLTDDMGSILDLGCGTGIWAIDGKLDLSGCGSCPN